MIKDDEKLIVYLKSSVNSVFKILPLYEEKNVGIKIYIESLSSEFESLQEAVHIEYGDEYISILSTLITVKREVNKDDSQKPIIKREVFKCINIIKNMVGRLEEDV